MVYTTVSFFLSYFLTWFAVYVLRIGFQRSGIQGSRVEWLGGRGLKLGAWALPLPLSGLCDFGQVI